MCPEVARELLGGIPLLESEANNSVVDTLAELPFSAGKHSSGFIMHPVRVCRLQSAATATEFAVCLPSSFTHPN